MSDPFTRHTTRHKGITYRMRQDGSRTYFVFHNGKQIRVEGGEKEAIQLQASLRLPTTALIPARTKMKTVAEAWYEQKKPRLRRRTADYYRSALDLVLLPRFGNTPISGVDPDAIAKLVRDLEREGLHAIDRQRPVRPLGKSSIDNYLKPLKQTLDYAVRRKMISINPFNALTSDDRPRREEKADPYEWSDEELVALYAASEHLAHRPTSRYDYSHVIRISAKLGLRIGEALGLIWRDFDTKTGVLTVNRQWTKYGEYGPTKTPAAARTIALPAAVRDELIALRLRSQFSQDEHPVFASRKGTPLSHRNVTQRGFEPARDLAELPDHLTFHDLRHAAASRMIYKGLDPVTVANVMGHEDATVTLKVYAKMFNRKATDDRVREALG